MARPTWQHVTKRIQGSRVSRGDAHHGDTSEPGRCHESSEEVRRDALPAFVGIDDKLCDPSDGF